MQIEALQILPDDASPAPVAPTPTATGAPRGGRASASPVEEAPASVYYVCKVLFVNSSSADVTPALDHFVFVSQSPRATYRALTSGLPAGIDATNPTTSVKAGDKQEYTLVFHVPTGAIGTVLYQP